MLIPESVPCFGVNKLVEKDAEILAKNYDPNQVQTFLHNKFNFGGIAFEASNFITYTYLHDRNFIRDLCINKNPGMGESKVYLNGFCAQALIFMRTMDYISQHQSGGFNDWIEVVFDDIHFKELSKHSSSQYDLNGPFLSSLL